MNHSSAKSTGNQPMMRAAVLERYGPPKRLSVREVPRPACGRDQVLIRVHAAGINPIDWRIRSGSLRMILPLRLPLTPGYDIAGEIVEVGPTAESSGWKVGDAVFSYLDTLRGGGYAEYAAAGVNACAAKPDQVSFEEAAGVPLAASTALRALRDIAHLTAGQTLLVNGASGGVGTFAVQIGTAMGASVTGVCSGRNLDFVRDLGAERVIDYTKDDFTAGDFEYDVVFDAVAKSSFRKARRVLAAHGCYVITVPSPESLFYSVATRLASRRCRHVLARSRGDDLRTLSRMIAEGKMRPVVQDVYPLDAVAQAHEASQSGRARGKIILAVGAAGRPMES